MRSKQQERKLVGMLITLFPGRVPEDTALAWLGVLETERFDDLVAAIPALAKYDAHPTLQALVMHVDDAKKARVERERSSRRAIAGPTMSPERTRKCAAAAACVYASIGLRQVEDTQAACDRMFKDLMTWTDDQIAHLRSSLNSDLLKAGKEPLDAERFMGGTQP